MQTKFNKEEIITTLIDYFLDDYDHNDPVGAGDYLAQGGQDEESFVAAVRELKKVRGKLGVSNAL